MRDIVLRMLAKEFQKTYADESDKVLTIYKWMKQIKQARTNKFIDPLDSWV
jgi:hypothetical protein